MKIAKESSLEPLLTQQVISSLDTFTSQTYREKYPKHATRYGQEIQKELDTPKCTKRWDILCISTSILCFIPSHILIFCHCCYNCDKPRDRNGELIECGNQWVPLAPCNNTRKFSDLCPSLNFFCKPIGNIKNKLAEYKHQNEIIEEIYSRAPMTQQMK